MTDARAASRWPLSHPGKSGVMVRRWIVATVVYAAVLLVGLLTPLDLYGVNDATSVENGLEFRGSGIAWSIEPPVRLHRRLVSTGALTVELWAESAGLAQSGPARLVTYTASDATGRRNFTLGQEGADLHVRLRTTRSPSGTDPSFTVEDVFSRPGPRQIVLTFDGTEERVYVDGALRKSSRDRAGSFDNWDPEYILAFGNELSGTRPWRGRLGPVVIYDRALGPEEVTRNHASELAGAGARVADGVVALYRLRGTDARVRDESGLSPALDLEIPLFVHARRRFLDADRKYLEGRFVAAEAAEIVVNVVIFVPLGFFIARTVLAAAARLATVTAATLSAGVLLSLGVETAQYLLVARHSELGDVLLNGIGTLLGLLLAVATARRPLATP